MEIWSKSDAMLNNTSFCHNLDHDPNINSLGPKFGSRPIGSLGYGVSLVLDPNVVNSP